MFYYLKKSFSDLRKNTHLMSGSAQSLSGSAQNQPAEKVIFIAKSFNWQRFCSKLHKIQNPLMNTPVLVFIFIYIMFAAN